MGTPFITFLEPGNLEGFKVGVSHDAQPPSVPRPFLDAIEVREAVFVQEQEVTLENEIDADDPRACHWTVYASVNKTEEVEVRHEDGTVMQPRKSSTRTTPIGTIRLVPFPHDPHPIAGGRYWNGVLEGEDPSLVASRHASAPDTTLSVQEPYVKLGRLAVLKEFRGNGLATLLVNTALSWLKANPSYFDPSATELGLELIGAKKGTEIPKWGGLVRAYAQEQAIGAWAKWGFQVDEAKGRWWEEGIAHVSMFQRLRINPKDVSI